MPTAPSFSRDALSVKRASLAAEARIIRNKINSIKRAHRQQVAAGREGFPTRAWHLHDHRIRVVRPEARAAHLAHAFLTGRPYSQVEVPGSSPPDWKRVEANVKRFCLSPDLTAFTAWKDAAELHRTSPIKLAA